MFTVRKRQEIKNLEERAEVNEKPVGLTQDAGYQIGVRRTFPAPRERIWHFLVSPEGLRVWLGDRAKIDPVIGLSYRAADGTFGEIRAAKPYEQLRLTWQPAGWKKPSTLQIRLLSAGGGKTTVAFHQEHLDGPETREIMKRRWEAALNQIRDAVEGMRDR